MKVLGKSSSINVRKVLWTCAEIGADVEHLEFGSGTSGDVTSSDFLQLNPNAMVPVLIDQGQSLWESNSICRYLAMKYQRQDLLPTEPMARAQVEKWMDWQLGDLNNAWRYAFLSKVRQSAAHQDAQLCAQSAHSWNQLMMILEAQLVRTGAYVVGDQFTLADIVLGLALNRWRSTPIDRPATPALDRYFDLLKQRPGYVRFGANGIA